jgi:DNA mismatch repair protein MutL
MNRVRLLSEQVANQIAAGEVIERPASVVKELVENSLDAGGRSIRVDVQSGGKSLMRVTDDGCGMSRDDALLCLERHATSKIQKAEDLACISTMGFRGEALPSIASVSRFTLTTREAANASPEGTRVVISGGKIAEVKAAGCPTGTCIEARQLFFNLPARRKFLRSDDTESAHIQHYLTLAALSHPEVAFTFYKDGRLVWQLPSVPAASEIESKIEALGQRLRAVYGGGSAMLPVNFIGYVAWAAAQGEGEEQPGNTMVRIWGLTGAPGVSRSTRDDQHLFVNKRPVDNRGLNYALIEGYHTSLMKGRYPICCLFLEIEPSLVDVNIHPAKREVKFHREYEVRRLMAEAVRQALLAFHSAGRATTTVAPPQSAGESSPPLPPHSISTALPGPPSSPIVPMRQVEALPHAPQSVPNPVAPPLPGFLGHAPTLITKADSQPSLAMGFCPPGPTLAPAQTPSPAPVDPIPLLDVPLRLIGVVGRLYVLFESDRGLVLLDQHAAHERVLFEQMLERLERAQRAPSQKLLLPQTVELPARDASFLRGQIDVLSKLGVGLSEFGDRTFLLDALPPFVKAGDPRQYVLELVDQLRAVGQSVNILRLGEDVVAKTVCRHAVKANDPLAGPELEKLVENLRRCAMPYTCPHGRPTLIEMSFRELEKKFGRVQ